MAGMGINDFSSASQWAHLAKEACQKQQQQQQQQRQLQQGHPQVNDRGGRVASTEKQEKLPRHSGQGWGVAGSLRNLITW